MATKGLPKSTAFRNKCEVKEDLLRRQLGEQLEKDMARMLQEQIDSDLTVVFGNETFNLHSCIVNARCADLYDVLKSMNKSCANYIQPTLLADFKMIIKSIYSQADTTAGIDILIQMLVSNLKAAQKEPNENTVLFTVAFDEKPAPFGIPTKLHENHVQEIITEKQASNKENTKCVKEHENNVNTQTMSKENITKHTENPSSNVEPIKDSCEQDNKATKSNDLLTNDSHTFTKSLSVLGADLMYMYQMGLHVDVRLVVNGVDFYAHRCVLQARSEYFAAMMSGSWSESESQAIELYGLDPSVLEQLLFYLYGGWLDILNLDLLAMADFYGLPGLVTCMTHCIARDKCHFFHKPCSECIPGVTESLQIAHTFNLEGLKNNCLNWCEKYIDKVLGCKAFAQLPVEIHAVLVKHFENTKQIPAQLIPLAIELDKVQAKVRVMQSRDSVIIVTSQLNQIVIGKVAKQLYRMSAAIMKNYNVIDEMADAIEMDYNSDFLQDIVDQAVNAIKTGDLCCVYACTQMVLDRYSFLLNKKDIEHMEMQVIENRKCFWSRVDKAVTSQIYRQISRVVGSASWELLRTNQKQELKTGAGYIAVEDKRTGPVPNFLTHKGKTSRPQSTRPKVSKISENRPDVRPKSSGISGTSRSPRPIRSKTRASSENKSSTATSGVIDKKRSSDKSRPIKKDKTVAMNAKSLRAELKDGGNNDINEWASTSKPSDTSLRMSSKGTRLSRANPVISSLKYPTDSKEKVQREELAENDLSWYYLEDGFANPNFESNEVEILPALESRIFTDDFCVELNVLFVAGERLV